MVAMVIRRSPTIATSGSEQSQGNGNAMEVFLFRKGTRLRCGTTLLLLKGLLCTVVGIAFCVWTPFDFIMDERMRMTEGLPSFELWATPPDQVVMNVYIFNYTNADKFLAGEEDVLRVEEIGPVVYRELLTHHNITRNTNDTISYVAKHTAKYWPEANRISLNDTIVVPNYAALSMVTYLHEAPFLVKFGFNLLMRQQRTTLFKTMTVWNFLWNYTDPILYKAHILMPQLAPINNIGMLHRIYEDFQDTVTMYVGVEHGPERFSLIDKFEGSSSLPNYAQCKDTVTNATEGMTYGQLMTRNSALKYWRKTICKVAKLLYEKDLVYQGIDTYKFVLPATSFDRTYPDADDCYKGYPPLPNGLTDVSNCMYNVPIAASFPHLMFANQSIAEDRIVGLQPNVTRHMSYVIIEPITGVPLEQVARSQSNLVVRKLSGFNEEVLRFSNRIVPMFWLEYYQVSLPWDIYILVYATAVLLQPVQVAFIATLFALGFWYTVRFGKVFITSDDFQSASRKYKALRKSAQNGPQRIHGVSLVGSVYEHSGADCQGGRGDLRDVQRSLLTDD